VLAAIGVGCGNPNPALEELAEAHRLSADLNVQFVKAADASNRAVMADTDEASVANAREAERLTQAVEADAAALKPILQRRRYANEIHLLEEFETQFSKYRAVDRTILDLAVENTNLKAQQLSFGSAQEAADAFRDAVTAVEPRVPSDAWQLKALVAASIASVREIQALEAPHVAAAGDDVMARLETRMMQAEKDVRTDLSTIGHLARPSSQAQMTKAQTALEKFFAIHRQILSLSHRNTNVRSLALSLNDKTPLTKACEDTLRALQEALSKRGFPLGR